MHSDQQRDPADLFSPATNAWFESSFRTPTAAQTGAWGPISDGENTLLCAPTGSGKTLAAFLWAIDSLGSREKLEDKPMVRVLYISPLRALAVDIEKNLRSPIRGIALAAERMGLAFNEPSVGVRTGDTTPSERRRLVRYPPDILITTPESLYLMLTSAARESLLGVESVIVDEIHALARTKRGAHLSLSLERLDHLIGERGDDSGESLVETRKVQRIGLSATQRPLETVARFLGGDHPVKIIDAGMRKELEIEVVVPVDDMGALGEGGDQSDASGQHRSIWPSIHPELLKLVQEHQSTLIFVNARRLSERLASRLNELAEEGAYAAGEASVDTVAGQRGVASADDTTISEAVTGAPTSLPGSGNQAPHELVKAHHGSLSRERRLVIEDELKRGELRGLVATSSLELGIDMGAVDLVIQVESPGSVASGLQRIGRAGHQVGAPSRGRIFPKHRADLLEAAVVVERMKAGLIEETKLPVNPLDVLAQQIVASCALDDWAVDELFEMCRRAANFSTLSIELFENTLDMLSGRYPAEEFAELRPRVVWDRLAGTVRGRKGAQRLAVTSGGTIPDRGLFGVFLPDGTRVGELDEEMVYESRVGETFLLGASTWRIEEITFERVVVTPAPGQPGKMPFWHGDGPGREAELGRAIGEFIRKIRSVDSSAAEDMLRSSHALDHRAAQNVLGYLDEQAEATGVVPDDKTIVIERFRDEIGDWRVCIHSPFGARVHAPWATIIRTRVDEHYANLGDGNVTEVVWSDDGIVLRLPEAATDLPLEVIMPEPDTMEAELIEVLPGTAAFAARFREAAARALLLPRRRPDQRTPLWQQRQRAADLLAVASKYPSFPILLEATRECCNDVFDLPALRKLLSEVRSRRIRVVEVETRTASPFARSLLFGWIAVFMYQGDAPLAERRAAGLSLDRELLRDLLGTEELRSLLDADVVDQVDAELQRLTSDRFARDPDEVHDLLRVLGPLTIEEISQRVGEVPAERLGGWLVDLDNSRRVFEVGIGGVTKLAAAEDAGRLRDALGVAVPLGLPAAFTEPVEGALTGLVERFARTHGPFTLNQVAGGVGVSAAAAELALSALVASGRVVAGEFRPGGRESEWCDAEVLRRLRRRSLAALRREVEPVDEAALTRFMCEWQGVASPRSGVDALIDAVGLLQGAALPASMLEPDVLSMRVSDYNPANLDSLCARGDLVWVGAGGVGAHDGRIRLAFRDQAASLLPTPAPPEESGLEEPHHQVIRELLGSHGASFWSDIQKAVAAAELPYEQAMVIEALWDLVWAGEVTNDSLAPLRAKVGRKSSRSASGARSRKPGSGTNRRRIGLSSVAPAEVSGRWSLTVSLIDESLTPTEVSTKRALQFLERYGVLTREMALAEGVQGGFAGVYPVLKLLEERGQVRRGYFVEGLGAAQFAMPGAVDLLRNASSNSDSSDRRSHGSEPTSLDVVLAATDTAQPYGAALAWPESEGHPARAIGSLVVFVDGEPCAYLERGGRKLITFPAASDHPRWTKVLAATIDTKRLRRLQVSTIDGESASTSPWAEGLKEAGFKDGYKGLTKG